MIRSQRELSKVADAEYVGFEGLEGPVEVDRPLIVWMMKSVPVSFPVSEDGVQSPYSRMIWVTVARRR